MYHFSYQGQSSILFVYFFSIWKKWIHARRNAYALHGSLKLNKSHLPRLCSLCYSLMLFQKEQLGILKRRHNHWHYYYSQASWIPQQDLLASGHVRLFVSQLGMVSLQEAVYHGVPILGLPLTYEQGLNSDIVTMKNIGETIYMTSL